MDLKYLYISVMAVIVVPSSAFQGNITINGNSEIGGNVTITCSWTLSQDERISNVQVRSLPVPSGFEYPYYFQFGNGIPWPTRGNQSNFRTSADDFDANTNRSVMRITNVQCADDRSYSCYFTYSVKNEPIHNTDRFSYLTVSARPKLPVIRWTPNTSTDILESSNISVVCGSNVGRSGHGSLQWKIYRRGVLEVIPPTDSRLSEMKNVSLEAGEDNCTQRVQQTFNMPVSRADQNLTIACFVQNDDFQSQTPDMCLDPAGDICNQTQSFRIVYGVNETSMNVDSVPPGSVYQDKTLTLTCQATGLPAPVYKWVQILGDNSTDPENNTFPGQSVGDGNQLVLSNIVAYGGQELKYTCTASNTALGKLYSVTKKISVQVLMTTTTEKTTSTTTTPTTPTTSRGSQSVNGTLEQNGPDDPTNTIIIVVVVVGSILIIALIVGIILWRRRQSKKEIEEPSEKPYNNRTNLSYQHSQPDLVADKKFTSPSLDNSFTEKKEDGLMYADLTYDNKPRSRKPMAINDTSSEYSDIQMPQV